MDNQMNHWSIISKALKAKKISIVWMSHNEKQKDVHVCVEISSDFKILVAVLTDLGYDCYDVDEKYGIVKMYTK